MDSPGSGSCGANVYGVLGGGGRRDAAANALLFVSGPKLMMLDPNSGVIRWTHEFGPPHVQLRVVVDDILPDLPGLEAAIGQRWGEDGCLINFPPEGEPRVVWENKLVVAGEYDERYDHYGGDLQVDRSDPAHPLLWSVRRYRCRGFDARTGKMISSLAYEIGGEQRRNYGHWALGRGKNGEPLAVVISEQVQEHVHAIRLHRDRNNELAWQHYYGEVLKDEFGVAVENLAIDDLDGDGVTEVAYSVRDPAQDFRSFVRVRDAGTGQVKWALPDHWGVTAFTNLGTDRASGLIVCSAPDGGMLRRGELEVYQFAASKQPTRVATLDDAQLWGSQTLEADGRQLLLVRQLDPSANPFVALYDLVDGKLKLIAKSDSPRIPASSPTRRRPCCGCPSAGWTAICSSRLTRTDITASTWTGGRRWSLDLEGGPSATMSAADLNNDGRAELVALTPNQRVQVLSIDDSGVPHPQQSYEHVARWSHHSPLLYDCRGDGAYCLVTPGAAPDGRLTISAFQGDGTRLWGTALNAPADRVASFIGVGGHFLPGRREAVGVSVSDDRHTLEGFHLLDARDGKLLWTKNMHRDGYVSMPYRIHGVPTAYDFDRDGIDDIGIDMLSYMAYLRGENGSFSYVRHTPNIRTEEATYAGHLYNTFRPVFRTPDDDQPHWFVSGGFGAFGLMNPDVVSGVWRVDLAYDTPAAVGMIDVDADGSLEVGYAARDSRKFFCRDLWSGKVEWELDLPSPPNAPCLSADVDGDGRGEFLIGSFCIGTKERGKGRVLWQAPTPMGWAVIADFDGDGDGEIACSRRGGVVC